MIRLVTNTKPSLALSSSGVSTYTVEEAYGEEESDIRLEPKLSRTSMLILEYKRFLAARKIQSVWRSHFSRLYNDRRTKAAIVIQKWWRRFSAQRNLFKMVEDRLQKTIIDHYNNAATKIQALWHGYRTRQSVHDMQNLKHTQVSAAEDLLYCVAFKLHHLLRTYSIPGVYSLKNSHCLSKVEKLLASLNFRFHNDRVRAAHLHRVANVHDAHKQFVNSKCATEVPYGGPNYLGTCPPKCDDLFKGYDADKRMYKIIAMYEESMCSGKNESDVKRSLKEKRFRKKIAAILERQNNLKRDFCGDVINSMKKWNIIGKNKLINKDIFRNPENVENFLLEVESYLNLGNTCHCRQEELTESRWRP